jgi:hypothetical protein
MRPKTKRKHSIDPNRRMGCTVTFRDARGHTWSCHESGKTTEALRSITSRIPEDKGVVVVSVSTWRTILRDLKGPWRRTRGMVDPYAVERALLGKIKRLDLLPPEAAPVFDRVDRRR